MRCKRCGWEGKESEIGGRTVYEDFGDVYCLVCPGCKRTQFDGDDMFEEVNDAR